MSLEKWDKYERPPNKMGECIVTGIQGGVRCESGWMVEIKNQRGEIRTLDSNWLKELEPSLF